MKLNAAQLRESDPSPQEIASIKRTPLYIIIDNVLDTYNVGAIFRLADAAAASKVYLVGQTTVPTDEKVGHKIHKASVGTWKWTPWKHTDSIQEAINELKKFHEKLKVVAIEQDKKAIPYTVFDYQFPLALILGHETEGVSREGLELSDAIVEIPMFGINKSLNVMVSLAIVMWHVMGKSDIVKT
ncbi:hypothetical protein HY469_03990 [Candidatus Roizmanbacteria bacterium]|nr:hypothetical protein [Candidatus Roizmanbacteria bacterium]